MTISRAVRIANNTDFLPAGLNGGFKRWEETGLGILDQLFKGRIIKSVEELQNEFDLPKHDFFRYLQVRHYLHTHIKNGKIFATQHLIWNLFSYQPLKAQLKQSSYHIYIRFCKKT